MDEWTPGLAWDLATGGPWPEPATLQGDARFMAEALREGLKGVGLSSPNPSVGCILVKQDKVIGRGVHTRAGDPHAEVLALRDASSMGENPADATAYITLEPCCHQGRTPPCTESLLRARIARVVVGVRDPNPRVDGGGIAILRASGLDVSEGVLKEACRRFHAPFFRLIRTGLPWVVLKLALDASGSAGPSGERTQITPAEIQSLAHALRRASGAIIVGRCTVEVDDPLLTDRWPEPVPPHRSFLRVVLDSQGRLGKGRRIWRPVEGQPTLRATVEELPPLRDVEDLRLPPGPGGCSLRHLLHELAAKGVDRVLVEGGPKLARAFLDQDLVDEFHCFRGLGDTGGTPLRLDLSHLGKVRFESNLSKGSWRILARPDLA